MTTTKTKTDKDILDGLVNDYLDACEAIEKHTTVKDQLAAQIIDRLPAGGKHEVAPGVGVRIQGPSARFDQGKAAEILTPEQYASICERKPSLDLAKAMLPGALLDQCKVTTGEPSVRRI